MRTNLIARYNFPKRSQPFNLGPLEGPFSDPALTHPLWKLGKHHDKTVSGRIDVSRVPVVRLAFPAIRKGRPRVYAAKTEPRPGGKRLDREGGKTSSATEPVASG